MTAPVVDTAASPHAVVRPVGVGRVRLEGGFWGDRLRINREVTIPGQHEDIERTGRLDNFRRAAGRTRGDFRGRYYNDSDVYKWMEACAWHLAAGPDAELETLLERVIDDVIAAQQPDGYLNSFFMFDREAERWTDLTTRHELYCGGHLIQAAVAHHRATGRRTLLDAAVRWANLVDSIFGPGKRDGVPGHEEVEMALVELARETGERRYRDLAQFFVDRRGRGLVGGNELQDAMPVREATGVVGHAVRQGYLLAGAADLVAETGEADLRRALDRLWRNCVGRRMYVTGGCGSRYQGETFGDDYELPNDRAYAETCAAIANLMWQWRMLLLTGETRFADVMELALYNGFLAGWSLDGESYFYCNPLEHRGGGDAAPGDRGSGRRTRAMWDRTACCPPNVARTVAALPGYLYGVSDDAIRVHHFAVSTAAIDLPGGSRVTIEQRTDYPWSGEAAFRVRVPRTVSFGLRVRVPGWARSATLDGRAVEPGTYAEVRREWADGDTVTLLMPMAIERLHAHPHVTNNRGRVALRRGPIVYCIEDADFDGAGVLDVTLPADAALAAEHRPDLLGGVTVLHGEAPAVDPPGEMAAPYTSTAGAGPARPIAFTAVPYYAWANRTPGAMQVWIAEE